MSDVLSAALKAVVASNHRVPEIQDGEATADLLEAIAAANAKRDWYVFSPSDVARLSHLIAKLVLLASQPASPAADTEEGQTERIEGSATGRDGCFSFYASGLEFLSGGAPVYRATLLVHRERCTDSQSGGGEPE